jgi:hypothetical protein
MNTPGLLRGVFRVFPDLVRGRFGEGGIGEKGGFAPKNRGAKKKHFFFTFFRKKVVFLDKVRYNI